MGGIGGICAGREILGGGHRWRGRGAYDSSREARAPNLTYGDAKLLIFLKCYHFLVYQPFSFRISVIFCLVLKRSILGILSHAGGSVGGTPRLRCGHLDR